MLLCDVTMTLIRQEKIGNIFFLKQHICFLKKMNMNHFYPKMHTAVQISTKLPALLCGPLQANLVLIAYVSSEGSDEPAHPRSLARTSATGSYKQWVKRNLQTESQIPGPSEWLGMRS